MQPSSATYQPWKKPVFSVNQSADVKPVISKDIAVDIKSNEKNIVFGNANGSDQSSDCCCNGTITSLNDFYPLNCNSNINITNIPPTEEAQKIANSIITPSQQPSKTTTKVPLVATKMFDLLLDKIYQDFVTNPKIIRLFDAFNYTNEMSVEEYDNIVETCVLYWKDTNFDLFKQDTKLFFNFTIQDYICGKFYVSYKPYVKNCTKLIDSFDDPNYGANGHAQWIGNYIATKYKEGTSNTNQNIYVDGYKFSSARAQDSGQYYETRGFQQKCRALCTTFSGTKGTDVTFQWILTEIDTAITTQTSQIGENTLTETIETNSIGQTKITNSIKDKDGYITAISVIYINGLTYNLVRNVLYF